MVKRLQVNKNLPKKILPKNSSKDIRQKNRQKTWSKKFFKKLHQKNSSKKFIKKIRQYTLLTAEIIKWQKCAGMGLNGFHTR